VDIVEERAPILIQQHNLIAKSPWKATALGGVEEGHRPNGLIDPSCHFVVI